MPAVDILNVIRYGEGAMRPPATSSVATCIRYDTSRGDSMRRGGVVSGVCRMNEVNARLARLVLGWVTVFGRGYHIGM